MSFNKARRCWCSVSEREGWGGGRSSNSWFVGFQSPSIIRRWWWSLSGRHWKKPPGFLRPVQNNNRPRGRFLTWSGGFTGTGSGGGRRCVRRVWLVLPGQLTSAAPAQQQVEPLRRSALTQPSAVSDSALWLAAADRGPAHLFSFFFFLTPPPLEEETAVQFYVKIFLFTEVGHNIPKRRFDIGSKHLDFRLKTLFKQIILTIN